MVVHALNGVMWSPRRRFASLLLSAMLLPLLSGEVLAQVGGCGDPFRNHFGPFDYRTATANTRYAVESHHFTPEVQTMQGGKTTTKAGLAGDIAYTLKVFPNHHAALKTMADWSLKTKRNPPQDSPYSVECWFERASKFRPDDAMVKMLNGNYLLQRGRTAEAIGQLEAAAKLEPENANLHYNLGLAYVKLKRFDEALRSAHIAYGAGFPLPGLRNQLKRAGVWREQ